MNDNPTPQPKFGAPQTAKSTPGDDLSMTLYMQPEKESTEETVQDSVVGNLEWAGYLSPDGSKMKEIIQRVQGYYLGGAYAYLATIPGQFNGNAEIIWAARYEAYIPYNHFDAEAQEWEFSVEKQVHEYLLSPDPPYAGGSTEIYGRPYLNDPFPPPVLKASSDTYGDRFLAPKLVPGNMSLSVSIGGSVLEDDPNAPGQETYAEYRTCVGVLTITAALLTAKGQKSLGVLKLKIDDGSGIL